MEATIQDNQAAGNTTQATQPATTFVAQPQVERKFETVILKGEEIYESMSQFGGERDYRDTSTMAGQKFYLFTFRGRRFTADPKFQAAFEAGKLTKVTLTETEYDQVVDDPNNAGKKLTQRRQGWNIDGSMTSEKLKGIRTAKKEQLKDDLEIMVFEKRMERISTEAIEMDEVQLKELMAKI